MAVMFTYTKKRPPFKITWMLLTTLQKPTRKLRNKQVSKFNRNLRAQQRKPFFFQNGFYKHWKATVFLMSSFKYIFVSVSKQKNPTVRFNLRTAVTKMNK